MGQNPSYFPLNVGDYWEYLDHNAFTSDFADTLAVAVLQDTIVANKTYKLPSRFSFHYGGRSFSLMRSDSLGNIFRYNTGSETEDLWYRLSDTSRSIWRRSDFLARWDTTYLATIFGSDRRILRVLYFGKVDTNLLHPSFAEYLCQGIGLLSSYMPEGAGYSLRGARIMGITMGVITTVKYEQSEMPTRYAMWQNYPNPFNPSTTISYSLPKAAAVSLRVFNTLGQEVAVLVNEQKSAGTYQAQWNANAPSGIYFYRFQANEASAGSARSFVETKKMILLK